MYVNGFAFGILVTLVAEIFIVIIAGVVVSIKEDMKANRKEKDDESEAE